MKAKPILLETKDKSSIGVIGKSQLMMFDHTKGVIEGVDFKHIYLIDETAEIKEGDWCLIDKEEVSPELKSEVFKVDKILKKRSHNLFNNETGWRFSTSYSAKIIASTDLLLKIPFVSAKFIEIDFSNNSKSKNLTKPTIIESKSLPLLSEQSIKLLIDYYNKNGKMPESVEIEKDIYDNNCKAYYKKFCKSPNCDCPKHGLLLNSQGTVDITIPEEKMYSREEVVTKCLKMQHDYPKFVKESYYTPNMREIAEWTNKWIEDNL